MSTCPSPSPQSIAGAKRGKEKVALRALLPPPPSPTARWVPRNMGGKEGGRHFIGNKSLSGEEGERREGGVICEDSGTEREEKGSRAATDPFFSHSSLLFFSDWENGRCQFGVGAIRHAFRSKKREGGREELRGEGKKFCWPLSWNAFFLGGGEWNREKALAFLEPNSPCRRRWEKSVAQRTFFGRGENTQKFPLFRNMEGESY